MVSRRKGPSEPAPEDSEDSFDQLLAQIGQRVKEIRMMQGLNTMAAGEFTGVGAPQFSRIEQGRINMTLRVLHRIAQGLGVPPHELLLPREQSGVLVRQAKKKRKTKARRKA